MKNINITSICISSYCEIDAVLHKPEISIGPQMANSGFLSTRINIFRIFPFNDPQGGPRQTISS